MDIYNYTYYGDYYTEPGLIPAEDQGEGTATDKEVAEAIANALNKIGLVKTDDDSYTISTNTNENATIDDIYLSSVERADNEETGEKLVKFNMTNGKGFTVPLEMLDDPNLDCNTF